MKTHDCCTWLLALCLALAAQLSSADSRDFGPYEVHFSVFNTTFLQPQTASAMDIEIARNRLLVNVAVTPKGEPGGLAAEVSGVTRDLMTVEKKLPFFAVEEPGATYYLAPFKVTEGEFIHFYIDVAIPEQNLREQFKFTRRLHVQ